MTKEPTDCHAADTDASGAVIQATGGFSKQARHDVERGWGNRDNIHFPSPPTWTEKSCVPGTPTTPQIAPKRRSKRSNVGLSKPLIRPCLRLTASVRLGISKAWRLVLAALAGLAVLAGGLGGTGYLYYQFGEATENPHAEERFQPARDAMIPGLPMEKQAEARSYQPNCQQPQKYEDADLCAQWGAVKAVNETNRLTRLGLQLAALGFLFAVVGGLRRRRRHYYLIQAFRGSSPVRRCGARR